MPWYKILSVSAFLMMTKGGQSYVFGPIAALAMPTTTTASSTGFYLPAVIPQDISSRLANRPNRMKNNIRQRAETHRPSDIVFPDSDDSRFGENPRRPINAVNTMYPGDRRQQIIPTRPETDSFSLNGDFGTIDYPEAPDDSIRFDGPTSAQGNKKGGAQKPSNTHGWDGQVIGRPRPTSPTGPSWQNNGDGRRPLPSTAPGWNVNEGRRPRPPSPATGGEDNWNAERSPPLSSPGWQGNEDEISGTTPSDEEGEGTTMPPCECPTTSEFNPVCGEIDDERISFRNLSEFNCANICTQAGIKLLFHSSCRGIVTNVLYPIHHFTSMPPPSPSPMPTS